MICLKYLFLCPFPQFGCCEALCLLALNFPVCTWSTGWHCGYVSSNSSFSSRSSLNRRGRALRFVHPLLLSCFFCCHSGIITLQFHTRHYTWLYFPYLPIHLSNQPSFLVPLLFSMSQPSGTPASSSSSSAPEAERRTLIVGMANMILSLLSSAWFPLDLSAHQDALLLSGNLLSGW